MKPWRGYAKEFKQNLLKEIPGIVPKTVQVKAAGRKLAGVHPLDNADKFSFNPGAYVA